MVAAAPMGQPACPRTVGRPKVAAVPTGWPVRHRANQEPQPTPPVLPGLSMNPILQPFCAPHVLSTILINSLHLLRVSSQAPRPCHQLPPASPPRLRGAFPPAPTCLSFPWGSHRETRVKSSQPRVGSHRQRAAASQELLFRDSNESKSSRGKRVRSSRQKQSRGATSEASATRRPRSLCRGLGEEHSALHSELCEADEHSDRGDPEELWEKSTQPPVDCGHFH